MNILFEANKFCEYNLKNKLIIAEDDEADFYFKGYLKVLRAFFKRLLKNYYKNYMIIQTDDDGKQIYYKLLILATRKELYRFICNEIESKNLS